MISRVALFSAASLLLSAAPLCAATIGTNPPAPPITAERIAALPEAQRPAWHEYLARSQRQWQSDHDFFQAELKAHAIKEVIAPPGGHNAGLPLDRSAAWYGGTEALRIADIVVSFQTPAGGWSKNLDMTRHARQPVEQFSGGDLSNFLTATDNDQPHDPHWSYVGTFDNDATTTQMYFLAKVALAAGPDRGAPYRAAILRGFGYIFAAQFPNGGWPQVWPLAGGYHDTITYNDGAMIHVIELLRDAADGSGEFAFLPAAVRARAARSLTYGLACVLATQVVVNGRRTVWCQQHDALTFVPASARNYEMPAQTSGESAEIVRFLMSLPDPSPQIVTAVHAAAAWFEKTALRDIAYRSTRSEGRRLVSAPDNGPIWARYYEIGTDRPLFGDRDKSIHDNVNEISPERRDGYAWYGDGPKRTLEHYAKWRKAHPAMPAPAASR